MLWPLTDHWKFPFSFRVNPLYAFSIMWIFTLWYSSLVVNCLERHACVIIHSLIFKIFFKIDVVLTMLSLPRIYELSVCALILLFSYCFVNNLFLHLCKYHHLILHFTTLSHPLFLVNLQTCVSKLSSQHATRYFI